MLVAVNQVWTWLAEVPDPEIPVVSVVDLGMIRGIRWDDDQLVVSVTPSYSGCPASSIINASIVTALRGHGIANLRLEKRLSPAWTTDWITGDGRRKLAAYGIVPPAETAGKFSPLNRFLRKPIVVRCPRCDSELTSKISEFGSTPCKAQYRCDACREPFDYFKCV